jgi:hypothetical protein
MVRSKCQSGLLKTSGQKLFTGEANIKKQIAVCQGEFGGVRLRMGGSDGNRRREKGLSFLWLCFWGLITSCFKIVFERGKMP